MNTTNILQMFEPVGLEGIDDQPYVTGTEGENRGYTFLSSSSEFDEELDVLIQHVYQRKTDVENYLISQQ